MTPKDSKDALKEKIESVILEVGKIKLTKKPVILDNHTTVTDQQGFVSYHLSVLNNYTENRYIATPFIRRLEQFIAKTKKTKSKNG